MITAEESRNKSSQVKQTKLDEQLQLIELDIKQAIKEGRNNVLIEGLEHETPEEKELNNQIMKTLVNHGYKVKYSVWCIIARPLLTIRIEW
ncbi:MAG: hypothetical protein D8H99_28535 [Streptococcus sp.]|nr:MAG: hypothetical protein D8H99_28535 [Streptococcus sp.]